MEIRANLELLFSDWLIISLGIVAVAIVAFALIRLETSINKKKSAAVIV